MLHFAYETGAVLSRKHELFIVDTVFTRLTIGKTATIQAGKQDMPISLNKEEGVYYG